MHNEERERERERGEKENKDKEKTREKGNLVDFVMVEVQQKVEALWWIGHIKFINLIPKKIHKRQTSNDNGV